jgi:hypothetical protein
MVPPPRVEGPMSDRETAEAKNLREVFLENSCACNYWYLILVKSNRCQNCQVMKELYSQRNV